MQSLRDYYCGCLNTAMLRTTKLCVFIFFILGTKLWVFEQEHKHEHNHNIANNCFIFSKVCNFTFLFHCTFSFVLVF